MSALQGVIFDFDGVIANSEPLHLRAFQGALASQGLELTSGDYYSRYLGFDDFGVFEAVAQDRGIRAGEQWVESLVARKGELLRELMQPDTVLFPGARDFIRAAAAKAPIAIASGALRHEIDEIVGEAGLSDLFVTIVAAGDTREGKPSPEPYRLAFNRLQEHAGLPLDPRRCVAIEDSRWGLDSARGAGLRCVGVTTSYPAHELPGAELVVEGLKDLTVEVLDRLCAS